jgi:hypothetical protein
MVRLIFTGSQPKKDAEFFISVWWSMGGGVGILSLRDKSGRCIFELPSFPVLFSLQFNCAPTDGNYLQLFLAGRRDFSALGGWAGAGL